MIYTRTCLTLIFLTKCHSNLFHYLNQLFETKKHCVCFTLSNEYHYVWEDWYNYRVSLLKHNDIIKHDEERDINKIKNTDFKIKLTKSNF